MSPPAHRQLSAWSGWKLNEYFMMSESHRTPCQRCRCHTPPTSSAASSTVYEWPRMPRWYAAPMPVMPAPTTIAVVWVSMGGILSAVGLLKRRATASAERHDVSAESLAQLAEVCRIDGDPEVRAGLEGSLGEWRVPADCAGDVGSRAALPIAVVRRHQRKRRDGAWGLDATDHVPDRGADLTGGH